MAARFGPAVTVAWEAVAADVAWLDTGTTGAELASFPLFLDPPSGAHDVPISGEIPDRIADRWWKLKSHLLSLDADWDVWTSWYDDRLYGRPANEGLEIRRVLVPIEEKLWAGGAAVVNGRIKRLIAEYAPKGPPDVPAAGRGGFPVPVQRGTGGRRSDLLRPPRAVRCADPFRRSTSESSRSPRSARAHKRRSERVSRTIRGLLEKLGTDVSAINPHLVRSHWRNVDADAEMFAAAGAEAELAPDAIAQLRSLAGTLEDLQACYNELREQERELAKLQISGNVDAALRRMDEIAADVGFLAGLPQPVVTYGAASPR